MNVILRPMQRHEVWRSQYRARRYLEHLTGPSLEQRFKDVFLNLLTIQPDAKLGVLPITPEGHYWTVQFTHVLEEFVLRYGPYPNGFTNGFIKSASIPIPGTLLAQHAAAVLRGRKPLTSDKFVKYGMREHLNDLLDSGRIRIAPAATYNDSS